MGVTGERDEGRLKERGGSGGKGGDAVRKDGSAVEGEGSGMDMLVEEEEVGVSVVADPGRGRRDGEVGKEGGGRRGVLRSVYLHNHGTGLFGVDDGVVELLEKGCAGCLGVFGEGELKGAGMG